jgi:hypothetical protein
MTTTGESLEDAEQSNEVAVAQMANDVFAVRWGDARLKRLFYTVFIVGMGIGSIGTSLAFGFMLT